MKKKKRLSELEQLSSFVTTCISCAEEHSKDKNDYLQHAIKLIQRHMDK